MRAVLAVVVLAAVTLAGGAAQAAPRVASGTIAGPFGDARLGGTVTFQTTNDNLKGWQYPLVVVACYQDVDGDGVIGMPPQFEGSPDLVFAQLDYPDANFVLGGGSSAWLDRGGPATCIAKLYAYGFKGGHEDITLLASTDTWAANG